MSSSPTLLLLPLLFSSSLCQSSSPGVLPSFKLPLLSKICLLGLVGYIQRSILYSDARLQGTNIRLSISCYHFQNAANADKQGRIDGSLPCRV
ncbi:hypothetical protein AB3S75_010339 [Citrus x aurantiifolia]